MSVDFDVRGPQRVECFTVGSFIIDYDILARNVFIVNKQLFASQDIN